MKIGKLFKAFWSLLGKILPIMIILALIAIVIYIGMHYFGWGGNRVRKLEFTQSLREHSVMLAALASFTLLVILFWFKLPQFRFNQAVQFVWIVGLCIFVFVIMPVKEKTKITTFRKSSNQHSTSTVVSDKASGSEENTSSRDSVTKAQSNKAVSDSITQIVTDFSKKMEAFVAEEKNRIADSATVAGAAKNLQCLNEYMQKQMERINSAAQNAIESFRSESIRNVTANCCEFTNSKPIVWRQVKRQRNGKIKCVVYRSPYITWTDPK
ncbi:MAG TPA: hypothetical protein VG621_01810 [Candidatus Paceibacterota bacterium]|nr:hypothetical protein [Candidatus Paceibacterota bacterium]